MPVSLMSVCPTIAVGAVRYYSNLGVVTLAGSAMGPMGFRFNVTHTSVVTKGTSKQEETSKEEEEQGNAKEEGLEGAGDASRRSLAELPTGSLPLEDFTSMMSDRCDACPV